jgi:Na+/H+-dicarboxylate symporter
MVLGIIGLAFFWFWPVGVPSAILGLVLGIVGLRKAAALGGSGRGMAIAGLTCGAVGILLFVIIIIVIVNVVNESEDFFEESLRGLAPLA